MKYPCKLRFYYGIFEACKARSLATVADLRIRVENQRKTGENHGYRCCRSSRNDHSTNDWRGISREPARWARDLDIWGARQRCDHTPGLPQYCPYDRPLV